jgi:endo-1,4-beta-mannosidase
MWRTYDDALVRSELARLKEAGLTVTRSFLFWPDFHPEPDRLDPAMLERFGRFLKACEDTGLPTVPTFIVGHMSGSNWDPAWRQGRDLFKDGFMLGQQAFYIREVVKAAGDSPAVAAWLISNEMPWYTGPTPREYARAWGLITTAAVRAGGSTKPVSLGDGVWNQEVIATDNGFRLADGQDVVDFYGPHSYPWGNDQTRQMLRAAFICELSHRGKPVILEEFGVTDTFVSRTGAANYYRQTLHSSLLAGATGWMAWNNTDFDLAADEPYSSHPYELGFGLLTTDGTAKPALAELTTFGQVLAATDFQHLHRADTDVAVLFPAHIDLDLPLADGARHLRDRELMVEIAFQTWITAKRAELRPAIIRESSGADLSQARLILAGSNKALLGQTWPRLLKAAAAGSHVYVSWWAGENPNQRGAWWPALEPVFGIGHELRYGLNDLPGETVELTVVTAFGSLTPGDTFAFPVAGEGYGRSYLPLGPAPAGVQVLLQDAAGRPALVRRPVGQGAIYLGAYPIEYYAAVQADANNDDFTPWFYVALAAEAGLRPDVIAHNDQVYSDVMYHEDGRRFAWVVSLSPKPLKVDLLVDDSPGSGIDVVTRQKVGPALALPPFGVQVLQV